MNLVLPRGDLVVCFLPPCPQSHLTVKSFLHRNPPGALGDCKEEQNTQTATLTRLQQSRGKVNLCSCCLQAEETVNLAPGPLVCLTNRAPGAAQNKSRSQWFKQASEFTFPATLAVVTAIENNGNAGWLAGQNKAPGEKAMWEIHPCLQLQRAPSPQVPEVPAGHWMCPKLVFLLNNRKTSIQGLWVTTAASTQPYAARGKFYIKDDWLKYPEPWACQESVGLPLILSWRPVYYFQQVPMGLWMAAPRNNFEERSRYIFVNLLWTLS